MSDGMKLNTERGVESSLVATQSAGSKRNRVLSFTMQLIRKKPFGAVCLAITLVMLVVAIFAPFIAPYGMNETRVGPYSAPPSSEFPLGTDNLGRDMLSRIIYGARTSVVVGLSATAIATAISALLGMLSGYYGGVIDISMQRIVDAWMCFPGIVLLMVLVSVFGAGILQLVLVLGVSWGIIGSRIIRSATISIRGNVYIQAARAIGCKTGRILFKYILPNLMPQVIILFTTRIPAIILTEASLSFLGFGVPPPTPSWGGMLSSSRDHMFQAPWMAVWPGLALSVIVYCVNMFGDAVRDLVDPRLKGGVGTYGIRKKSRKVKTTKQDKRL